MPEGAIIAIGGHEDRVGDRVILRAVADALGAGPLLILATASRRPFPYFDLYRTAFDGIGVHDVRSLDVRTRDDADDPELLDRVSAAGGVFLTGGSQRRLVDPIRDSRLHQALRDLHARGGVLAGTSAGASALGECMLAGTEDVRLSDGLGLLPDMMIDQHFSQRNRIGRLREALTRTTDCNGLGIDEDTAVVVRDGSATVIGSGQAWMLDRDHPARRFDAGSSFSLGDTIAA